MRQEPEPAVRQVTRQLELFLEDGLREHITVALAVLDSVDWSVGPLDEYRGQ